MVAPLISRKIEGVYLEPPTYPDKEYSSGATIIYHPLQRPWPPVPVPRDQAGQRRLRARDAFNMQAHSRWIFFKMEFDGIMIFEYCFDMF